MRSGCFTRALAAALVPVALAACGSEEPELGGSGRSVTVEHEFGVTEIPKPPERVVTVGYNDQDFALALGVQPVGVREWFGERPRATWPWAEDELGDAQPEVLPAGELNFEQIAALRPDLILGVYAGLTREDYDKLSRIAPTVPDTGEHVDYGTPWQDQLELTGLALGREQRATALRDDIEARFTAAREEHPEFADATALFAYREGSGAFGAYSSADPRGRFLRSLGFRAPDRIDAMARDQFFAEVSGEQLRLIDEDVLVMLDLANVAASRDDVIGDPLYRRLDVVREHRDVYPDVEPAAALSFSSPLSLPLAIDEIVPQLEEAVGRLDETRR
jgi:iron complex transport system substrate-binding protein